MRMRKIIASYLVPERVDPGPFITMFDATMTKIVGSDPVEAGFDLGELRRNLCYEVDEARALGTVLRLRSALGIECEEQL